MKLLHRFVRFSGLGFAFGLFLVTGCTTLEPLVGVEAFSRGITAARTQTQVTFTAIARTTREDSFDRAASQPSLNASNLISVPSAAAAAAWDDLFVTLERYGQNISALASADATKGVESELVKLAAQFNDTADKLKRESLISTAPEVSAGLAGGFTEAARLILLARAQAEARKVAAGADMAMATVFKGLADAIGATSKEGLRHLVAAHGNQRQAAKQQAFLATKSATEKRRITQEFAAQIEQSETQDIALAALRRSFLALADAHHAIAQGHAAGLHEAIDVISTELKHAHDLRDQLATALKP